MANVVITAPACIGPTYSVTVTWDAGSGLTRFFRRLFRWLLRLFRFIFRARSFTVTTSSYSVACSGPGTVSNTQPPPPYSGPSGSVTFTFTGATGGGTVNATLTKDGSLLISSAQPVTVGWCPYSSMAVRKLPAAQLAGCRQLHVTVPDGEHAGIHPAPAVGHLVWRPRLGGLTCDVAAEGPGLVLRVGPASATPREVAFEPFSATFPGALLGARGDVLVTEA